MPPDGEKRPPKGAHRELATSSLAAYRERDRRAAHVLRVAWLRAHGHRLFAVDPTGQTSAALWDFADLLEATENEGRWAT
jgi:hypothetical protein